jgi:iron complex outermembrane receptor protein/hemoglobin/transferrin/lactoferrin receptor protein
VNGRAGLLAAGLLLLSPWPAAAQVNPDEVAAERELAELLKVTAVTGARHDQRLIDSPRQIAVLTAQDIRRRNYRNTPEAVADITGVFVQETNDGGGSPIIRGLIGNQILILIDGIRLNTSAYRLGPNQYLNTIDLNQIERVEVVRGAGSVLYGSDALGGVINIITRSAGREPGAGPVGARWFSRLASNRGAIGRGEISAQSRAVGLVGGLTLKRFGTLRGGRDTGVQALTGYDEWDGDVKAAFQLGANQQLIVAGQRVTQRHVQRPDVVAAGTELKWEWDPETRGLVSAHYVARELPGFVEQVAVTASFQQQAERYQRIAAATPAITSTHVDRTRSLGASVQFASTAGPRHLLTYGFDGALDRIASRRDDVSSLTGVTTPAKGLLADGARYQSLALFLQDEIDVSPRLRLNLGTRYGSFDPHAVVSDPSTGPLLIDTRQLALTSAARALFRLTPAIDLVGGVGQGFRAPNLDDLTVLGRTGSRFEVPNPDLEPEASVTMEAGFRGRSALTTGSATYFLTDIDGLIQRGAGTFNGREFQDIDGDGLRDPGEPQIFQRQNAGRARLHGVELEGRLRPADDWTVSGTVVRTVGTEQVTGDPLRRIPPTYGRAVVGWSPNTRVWADAYTVFASRQARLAPGDVTDIRIPAGGTPGFATLNARGGVTLTPVVDLTVGLENITNETYRTHGSGIDSAGINAVLGLTWIF